MMQPMFTRREMVQHEAMNNIFGKGPRNDTTGRMLGPSAITDAAQNIQVVSAAISSKRYADTCKSLRDGRHLAEVIAVSKIQITTATKADH
jgi:hypothetical protein